jgi:autotransporter-associated beta strand protein
MNKSMCTKVITLLLLITAIPLLAADKYSTGSISWDTSSSVWGTSSGGPYSTTWNSSDDAFLEGTAGTVTLGETITLRNLNINVNSYTVTGDTLAFDTNGVITNKGNSVTISSGITGDPEVEPRQGGNQNLTFSPTSANVALGTVSRPSDNYVNFAGSTTGNTIVAIPKGTANAKVRFNGSGTWTVGNVYGGYVYIDSGNLVVNGELTADYRQIELRSGAILHWNNAAAIKGPTSGSNSSEKFHIYGGSIDNSSGAAITTSTWNPAQGWYGDWMFIGSLGASSDLNMGAGPVTLTVSSPAENKITLTVSNSLTTLTVGGGIGDGGNTNGLVKSGAGTLLLQGTNTYTGETIVGEGLLDLRHAASLSSCSAIEIDVGGTLRLEHADNGGSAWDFTALSTLNPNLRAGIETGTAANLVFSENVAGYTDVTANPANPNSIAYWDGNDTTANADGGAGTWDTSSSNWDDAETSGSSVTWDADNTDNDTAVLDGSSGTVSFGSDIDLRRMEIRAQPYQIGSNTETYSLIFGSLEPRITFYDKNCTIKAGITGSPEVLLNSGVVNVHTYLEPVSANMTLGVIHRLTDDYLHLDGTTTGNTIASIPKFIKNAKLHKDGSGTWTVNGECYGGEVKVNGGTLICHGKLWESTWDIYINNGSTLYANGTMEGSLVFSSGTLGGTAVCNLAVSVPSGSTLAPGYPMGNFTITNNNCTIAGSLAITLDGTASPQYSSLNVDGTLDISAGTSSLDFTEVSFAAGEFVIANYTTLIGTFGATNGLPKNATIDYNYNSGSAIALIVPYPSGLIYTIK